MVSNVQPITGFNNGLIRFVNTLGGADELDTPNTRVDAAERDDLLFNDAVATVADNPATTTVTEGVGTAGYQCRFDPRDEKNADGTLVAPVAGDGNVADTDQAGQLAACGAQGDGTTYEILGNNLITVDSEKPVLSSATTGKGWNPATEMTKTQKNSIQLAFADAGADDDSGAPGSGLDSASVTVGAFSVTGHTVVAAQRVRSWVFLTLADDLGSTERPDVRVSSGAITDRAGNAADGKTVKASDGLGPNLSLSKSADLSNDKVTVTITTDEQLGDSPLVWVTKAGDRDGAAKIKANGKAPMARGETLEDDVIEVPASDIRQTGSLVFSYTMNATGANDGEYSVFVRAEDAGGNTSTKGDAASSSTAKAFSFEIDNRLNGSEPPVVTVADKDTVTEDGSTLEAEAVDPLIVTVDFSNEGLARGKEYHRDGYRTVELTSAKLKVSFADGTSETTTFNLTTDVTTPDNVKFTIPVLNPQIGTYELTLQAEDSAGNVRTDSAGTTPQDLKATWKVISPRPVNVELAPGWNLVSLPFQPANPAINSVIPSTHPADIVMTFDNASQVWLVSRRDAETGQFVGDINVMTASTAYFIRTENFSPIRMLRPPLATAAAAPPPPPAITVVEGWNLVPVVSNEIPTPSTIAADVYFGTLGNDGWLKALTFDTLVRTWVSVTPGSSVTLADGDRNPCTGMPIDAEKVAAGTEPCQIGQYDEKSTGTGDYREGDKLPAAPETGTDPYADLRDGEGNANADIDGARDGFIGEFDGNDRVTIGTPVTVGKGYWLYSTIDGVIIP